MKCKLIEVKLKLLKIVKIVLKYKFQKTHDKNYTITIIQLNLPFIYVFATTNEYWIFSLEIIKSEFGCCEFYPNCF